MEKLYNQTNQLVKDLQMIADNIFDYNSGLCKKRIPLNIIQYDIATLARDLAKLHGEIGEKIRNDP